MTNFIKKRKIVAYFRRSTEDQENSIERQRIAFQTFLKGNDEFAANPDVFIEDGVSGDSSVERPVQRELLRAITQEELVIDELFVADSSRWGRFNTHHKSTFTLPLKIAGVKLRTPSTLIDFNDPTSDLLYDVHQNLSYIENHERSHRVVAGTAAKIYNKQLILLECYGLRRQEKRLIAEEKAARVVRFIFREFLKTESRNAVVGKLNNEEKIPSPSGKKWTIQTVIAVLKNPKYAGHYCYGQKAYGKIHRLDGSTVPLQRKEKEKGVISRNETFFQEYCPDLVEPIVDLNTWGQTQLLLIRTARSKTKLTKKRYTGVVVCGCGRVLRGRTRNALNCYSCQTGRAAGCSGAEHLESEIDDSILEFLKVLESPNASEELLNQHQQATRKFGDDEQKLAQLQRRYKTALERLANLDCLLPEGFSEMVRTLKREIDDLQSRIENELDVEMVSATLPNAVAELQALLNGLTDQQKIQKALELGVVQRIQMEAAHQQHGRKVFSAVKSHSITYSMGRDSYQRTGDCTTSS